MEQKTKTSPGDFFLYLAAIVALYVSTGSMLGLLFDIINRTYPDPLQYYVDPYSGAIRFAIASLFVLFPVYIVIMRWLHKDMQKHPDKRESRIRKWLAYLTLFVAGAVVIGDLIALINSFLGGDLTARFMWKVIVVLVVTGTIFGYYLYDLKWRPEMGRRVFKIFMWGTALFVLTSIVFGFVIMGSPATQRALRFDADRISHLNGIQWQIVNYWQSKQVLPATIEDLGDLISGYAAPSDPDTNESYGYHVTGERAFELCATFALESEGGRAVGIRYPTPTGFPEGESWAHGVGETCFTRTIDPELYPPRIQLQKSF